jgi:hypothetical protein
LRREMWKSLLPGPPAVVLAMPGFKAGFIPDVLRRASLHNHVGRRRGMPDMPPSGGDGKIQALVGRVEPIASKSFLGQGGKRKGMPYTHYWRRLPELPEQEFAEVAEEAKVIIEAVSEMGVPLAGPKGEGDPILSHQTVAFNGVKDCGHQYRDLGYAWPGPKSKGVAVTPVLVGRHASEQGPLLAARSCGGSCAGRLPMGAFFIDRVFMMREWDQIEKGRYFQFCETDFKPYDLAVTAVLARFKERMPNEIYLSSDGQEDQWDEAKRLNRGLFGWGSRFVLTPLEEL